MVMNQDGHSFSEFFLSDLFLGPDVIEWISVDW